MSQKLFMDPLAQPPMQGGGSHKAALLLHALGERDRAWLLSELPSPQRQRLQDLLEELAALHIPADQDFLQHAISAAATEESSAGAPGRTGTPHASLESADAHALARVLGGEPAELIAGLLVQRDWPWASQVLAELRDSKRQQVQACLARHRAAGVSALGEQVLRRKIDRQLVMLLEVRLVRSLAQGPTEQAERRTSAAWPEHHRRPEATWWHRLLRNHRYGRTTR